MPAPRPAHAERLDAILAEAFRLLAEGVADRRSAFHSPTFATIGLDGAPTARTLVLRGFEPAARQLRLHTDSRSGKVEEVARDPRCALHVYDAEAQIQLRLAGQASLHRHDEVAEAAWTGSRPFSRICYSVAPSPGTPVPAPPAAPADPDAGRPNFAALVFTFSTLEWLWLSIEGHRRARFAWHGGPEPAATWLVP
jgi:hypothetical protein